jgi:hypothetical protein
MVVRHLERFVRGSTSVYVCPSLSEGEMTDSDGSTMIHFLAATNRYIVHALIYIWSPPWIPK